MMFMIPKLLYIDPGTGSMLATIVIGVISTLIFAFRNQFIKLKFWLSGGNGEKSEKIDEKIPYVIFSDSKRYWNVFKPICDEFEKRETEIRYWTASPDDPALDEPYKFVKCEFIGEGNKAFAKLNMMNARICLSTTPGLDVYQWKRSKKTDYYAHIYHAVGDNTGYRMFGCDFFDAMLLSGDFQERYIRILEEKRNLPAKETTVVGCTYLDEMMKRAKIEAEKHNDNEKPFTVLLAPSWGDGSILNRFGEKILDSLVKTGYKIVVRPHPQSEISDPELLSSLKKKFPESDMFSWNADNDNFKVLSESDIMITDFSGIMFDYSFIFDKPLIYAQTSWDTAPYDAAWIDEVNWRVQILPELGKELEEKDFDNIKAVIDEVSSSDVYKEGRRKYSDIAWMCKGKAAEKTADFLIAKYAELTEKSAE